MNRILLLLLTCLLFNSCPKPADRKPANTKPADTRLIDKKQFEQTVNSINLTKYVWCNNLRLMNSYLTIHNNHVTLLHIDKNGKELGGTEYTIKQMYLKQGVEDKVAYKYFIICENGDVILIINHFNSVMIYYDGIYTPGGIYNQHSVYGEYPKLNTLNYTFIADPIVAVQLY